MGVGNFMETSDRIDSSANDWTVHRRRITSPAMYAMEILRGVGGISLVTCQATVLKLFCCTLRTELAT